MALVSAGVQGVGGLSGTIASVMGAVGGMGGLGTAASAASGLVGAYSAVQQGNAAKEAAKATANQQEAAARESLRQGEQESDRQRRAGAAMMAQQKVAMAANGIDLGSQAAIEVLDDTKVGIEQDTFAIRHNATNNAGAYAQQAANSLTGGANAQREARWGAAGTLLTTGAKIGPKWRQWANAGAY